MLSEFAGAALELRGAILVNPHDLDGLKDAIRFALTLDADEARARLRRMRRIVRRHNVHTWADGFLSALRDTEPALGSTEGSHSDTTTTELGV